MALGFFASRVQRRRRGPGPRTTKDSGERSELFRLLAAHPWKEGAREKVKQLGYKTFSETILKGDLLAACRAVFPGWEDAVAQINRYDPVENPAAPYHQDSLNATSF